MPQAVAPSQLNNAKRAWTDLGYGLFVHFGMNTFDGKGWGDGKSPASRFAPESVDCSQWADVAVEAGMKYAVLTTKHHDGFCLWPSRQTEYHVGHSGYRHDVVRQYADAFRSAGLAVGLYYSLWDLNAACYEDDEAYAAYMRAQISELLTDYGPIVELWFDGGWDKDHPTRKWPFDPAWRKSVDPAILAGSRWQWKELYNHIHQLQPDCLVVNNSSSDRPGAVRHLPLDIRTAEHFDFVYGDKVCAANTEPFTLDETGRSHWLPLEYCTSVNPDWFWVKDRSYSHPSAATIADWRRRAREAGGNLLLNVGPTDKGVLPDYHRPFLLEAARQFEQSVPDTDPDPVSLTA
jgi:alpha-L-fucosidase